MRLKYQDEIDKLSPCFLGFDECKERPAFRWTFDDIKNANNFLPPPLANPGRQITDFKMWALSFFETKQQAEARLLHLTKDKPQLFKKLGTHVAMGIINPSDGIAEIKCDEDGHFNHFEFVGVDFTPNFVIVGKIKPE